MIRFDFSHALAKACPRFAMLICLWLTAASASNAQEVPNNQQTGRAANTQSTATNFPDLTVPANADAATLRVIVDRAKAARPTNGDQYKAQQTAIKTASAKLLQLLKKDDPVYLQAEVDSITASVALLTFFSEKDQTGLIQQLTEFLKTRKQLSIQDIQTGLMAGGMLELRPEKQPARDVYQLLDDLLKSDKREEMQSLRVNIQASIRRLEMLGRKFDFEATSIDGKALKTADFAGKYVLISFFAQWSNPSLEELVLIKSHFQKYSAKGLVVIGVSLDESREAVDKIIKENGLTWPIVHDNAANPLDRLQLKYGINSLPTVLLLNKEGTVISLEARNAEQVRLMQLLFETPTPAPPQQPGAAAGSTTAVQKPQGDKKQ